MTCFFLNFDIIRSSLRILQGYRIYMMYHHFLNKSIVVRVAFSIHINADYSKDNWFKKKWVWTKRRGLKKWSCPKLPMVARISLVQIALLTLLSTHVYPRFYIYIYLNFVAWFALLNLKCYVYKVLGLRLWKFSPFFIWATVLFFGIN